MCGSLSCLPLFKPECVILVSHLAQCKNPCCVAYKFIFFHGLDSKPYGMRIKHHVTNFKGCDEFIYNERSAV